MTISSVHSRGAVDERPSRDPHNDLHSEQGALPGEHPGRAKNPVVKVHDLAWLEFEKPDLDRAGAFAHAFGFTTVMPDGGRAAAARAPTPARRAC